MIKKEEVFRIGRLGKPHGVDGEMAFHFTDDVFDRTGADCLVLDMDGILVPFFIGSYRFKSDETALVTLDGIDSQDKAQELAGHEVYFLRRLADTDGEQPSWAQLVGFTLTDSLTGEVLGRITAVDDSTMNVLFEVETPRGRHILVPAGDDLLGNIDTEGLSLEYRTPDGLMDMES